jgi:hypothetical protein
MSNNSGPASASAVISDPEVQRAVWFLGALLQVRASGAQTDGRFAGREPWPLAQARQHRNGTAGGAKKPGPGRQVVSQDNQRRQPISRSGRDPGHRPYARTRPNPRKQGRNHTHILPAEYDRPVAAW